MKNIKICLSVAAMDADFAAMVTKLSKYAQVDVVGLDGFSLQGYDIFVGKKLSEKALATADRLKIVFAYKTGVDDFPLAQFKEKNVMLVNSHIDADYIAEYAFGLSLSLVNRITEFDKKLRRGIWYDQKNPYWRSIFSLKVGLVGYGHIGRKIHSLLQRNGIEAYTIDRGKHYEDINLVNSLEELCRKCDLLIISLPKTPETDNLFNKEIFNLLENKYIINVGRSNCIDQKALYDALKSEKLVGAAIDTWDEKPKNVHHELMPSKYPLVKLENIILSPHQAMRVNDGHSRYVEDTFQKIVDYIENKPLRNLVDLERGY